MNNIFQWWIFDVSCLCWTRRGIAIQQTMERVIIFQFYSINTFAELSKKEEDF